jgi:transcriptional regulator with XRE-family HTH domain
MSKIQNNTDITLGYILKKYRLQLELTHTSLSDQISIDKKYIIALENGNYQEFESHNQVFPILKRLSYVLGLKYTGLMELYQKEYAIYMASHQKNRFSHIRMSYASVRNIGVMILLGGICVYIGVNMYRLAYIPAIQLDDKSQYRIYEQTEYVLKGSITRSGELTLNGQRVILQEGGVFETPIYLDQGENRLELVVKKDDTIIDTVQKVIYKK